MGKGAPQRGTYSNGWIEPDDNAASNAAGSLLRSIRMYLLFGSKHSFQLFTLLRQSGLCSISVGLKKFLHMCVLRTLEIGFYELTGPTEKTKFTGFSPLLTETWPFLWHVRMGCESNGES